MTLLHCRRDHPAPIPGSRPISAASVRDSALQGRWRVPAGQFGAVGTAARNSGPGARRLLSTPILPSRSQAAHLFQQKKTYRSVASGLFKRHPGRAPGANILPRPRSTVAEGRKITCSASLAGAAIPLDQPSSWARRHDDPGSSCSCCLVTSRELCSTFGHEWLIRHHQRSSASCTSCSGAAHACWRLRGRDHDALAKQASPPPARRAIGRPTFQPTFRARTIMIFFMRIPFRSA